MSQEDKDQAWIDGNRAGYAKGRDDGIRIGYDDAKLRSYRALEIIENDATPATRAAVQQVKAAIIQMVGSQK